jgi:UDP-glucose 4-epimerase
MRILVTGSNGFVGGAFGRLAASRGHAVSGLSLDKDPSDNWPGEYRSADLTTADIAEALRDLRPDIIFHAAGPASVPDSLRDPLGDFIGAALVWSRLLDAVRRSGLDPLVVYPSSAAVYGNVDKLPVAEEAPVRPISPYGFHKAACELIAAEYNKCFGIRMVVCRLFSLFGPTQRRLLVWELYKQFVSREAVTLQGTGMETRDYLFIIDAVGAMLGLSESSSKTTGLLTVNIASGTETQILDLAREIGGVMQPKEIICGKEERPGDPHAWRADTSLLRSLVPGWAPQSLGDALRQCIGSWQSESLDLADKPVHGLKPDTGR